MQAYEVPSYFRNEWLTEYGSLPAAQPFVERFGRHELRRLARKAARDPEGRGSSQMAGIDPTGSQGEQASNQSSRDYCFIFFGPKVRQQL